MTIPLTISDGTEIFVDDQYTYWLMDAEGNFGRGPTPQDALREYLKVAEPEILAVLKDRKATFRVYWSA
jgi:hypothetical protein